MNAAQRRIIVIALFFVAVVCAGLLVLAVAEGATDELLDDLIWIPITAGVSLVAALYLRAGGSHQ